MTVAITEKHFSTHVEYLLKLYQWKWCHFRPARTEHGWRTALSGHKGFPDYIACRPPRLLIFELKSEKGTVSPEQQEWLSLLNAILEEQMCTDYEPRFEVYVWRPSDWEPDGGKIAEILR